ncbi:MAG: hypothetical protein N2512_04060, partial [Armatimonadetes bacterium]|nr:hypothetical protein [Armatimonadota bacterium]
EPLRGQKAQVWLEVEPNAHPSFDWAIWQDPRIETKETARARLTLTDETVWPLALVGDELVDLDAREVDAVVNMPGGVFLLRARPREIPADAELWELPFEVSFCDKTGMALNEPAFACGIVKETTVGGVTRPGIFAHPPNQGRTYVDFLVHLPQTPLVFKSWVGLGDGSRSTGCEFVVQVNGKEVASKTLLPEDGWQELSADLSPWAGKPIVLSLVTDSYGRFDCDWAAWGEPRLEAAKG